MPKELKAILETLERLRRRSDELYEEHLRVSAEYDRLKKEVDRLQEANETERKRSAHA